MFTERFSSDRPTLSLNRLRPALMNFDDYIFARPTFLRGVARALDIGGKLSQDAFDLSPSSAQADRRALASDWRVVGRDAQRALRLLDAEVNGAK